MLKTDWLKVATAGRTVDGREIKPEWLEKMAQLYSPRVYTATVNSEHFFYPGLGHVTELRAGKDELGRMALYARIAPTAELLARYQNRRQLFFSVEVMPDFPAKGDFYLSGLAVTDLPASQGLEPTQFSAEAGGRRRYFDTASYDEDEQRAEEGAVAVPEADHENPPRWWTALWGALRPHFAAVQRHDNPEQEPMTEQERQAFEALKAQVETLSAQVETLGERVPPEPEQQPAEDAGADLAARVDEKIAAAVQPIAERLGALEAHLGEPADIERGEVTGPAPGGESFVF